MNDPHVVALFYKVGHADHTRYENALPLMHPEAAFEIRIEQGRAEVRMKEHHATIDSARAVVDPFLRALVVGRAKIAQAGVRFTAQLLQHAGAEGRAPLP